MSEFALSTLITGDEIDYFCCRYHFLYQKTKFFYVFKHLYWSEMRSIISTYMNDNLI